MSPYTAQQIREDLTGIAQMAPDLEYLLTSHRPGSATAPAGRGMGRGKRAHPPAPVNLTVLEMLDTRREAWGILPILRAWAEVAYAEASALAERRQLALPDSSALADSPNLGTVCSWLSEHVHVTTTLPMWDAYAGEVHMLAERMAYALGEDTPDERLVHAGGCGERLDTLGPLRFACSGCGQSWTLLAVTLPEAAQRTGISLRTLQSWAARHLLVEVPGQSERRRMFDLDSIRAIAAERAARR
jgi:hypothetical protein